jgi:hypothetical protein
MTTRWNRGPHPTASTRRRLLRAALALALLGLPTAAARAQEGNREYRIKAACIFKFIRFVDWPARALPETSPNLVVGVFGGTPAETALDTLAGKSIKGKTLVVRQVTSAREAEGCHVVFISGEEREQAARVVEALQGNSVLTVGESPGFARRGGIINFTTEGNRLRFEINREAAERARLTISSQLLKLAKAVR